jgi:iron donor protein CyaY
MTNTFKTESEYRQSVQAIFEKIENAFDSVDPDVAECTAQMGVVSIVLADKSKCIFSAQPSVQQIWLVISSRSLAFHFNYDPIQKLWVDDKGQGLELLSFFKKTLKELVNLEIDWRM